MLLHLSVLRTNRRAPASATAIIMSGAYLGGVAGPLLFGWLAEEHSYRIAWLATSAWAAIGCATIALGHRLVGGNREQVDIEAVAGGGSRAMEDAVPLVVDESNLA